MSYRPPGRGPFRADQLRPGDPYELSDGHVIVSEPSGRRHGRKHLIGGTALATDPAVEEAGVEVGHVLDEATLRAPDVSVGGVADELGLAQSAPRLAVEYVERDGNEAAIERCADLGTLPSWRAGRARTGSSDTRTFRGRSF